MGNMVMAGPMQYRRFGRTELAMPVFSCGGMRFQDGWTDKRMSEVDPAIQENLEATFHRALEVGINHIETARAYGCSEVQLGQLLPKLPRERLIVQTKIGPTADPEEFYNNAIDSIDRLQLEHVDLFAIHGINDQETYDWSTRPGGCFDMALRLREEGRIRFIGFSTHGGVPVIRKAIGFSSRKRGYGFDYVNLHWYYIYQETWPCIEAAMEHDMGVFIISPTDKGGQLYQAPPRLHDLCAPLHPITFNDLYCLLRPQIHTLSVGAARPSDFNEHLDALSMIDRAPAILEPILMRLKSRYEETVEPELREPWSLGLPPIAEIPGQINVGRIVQLRNLAKAYDMVEYGKFRYNLIGNAGHWFPGQNANPQKLDPVRPALEELFRKLPAGPKLMRVLEEAHELLNAESVKRLSESE